MRDAQTLAVERRSRSGSRCGQSVARHPCFPAVPRPICHRRHDHHDGLSTGARRRYGQFLCRQSRSIRRLCPVVYQPPLAKLFRLRGRRVVRDQCSGLRSRFDLAQAFRELRRRQVCRTSHGRRVRNGRAADRRRGRAYRVRRETAHEGGDHLILLGRVVRFAQFEAEALLFAQGRYGVAEDHPDFRARNRPRSARQSSICRIRRF